MAEKPNIETRIEQPFTSFPTKTICSLYGAALLGVGAGVLGGITGNEALRHAGIYVCYGAQAVALPVLLSWICREIDHNSVTTHQ